MLVMELAPLGVFALMAWIMAEQGLEILGNMGKLAVALYLACFVPNFPDLWRRVNSRRLAPAAHPVISTA